MPKQRARDFLSTRKTLVMATIGGDGMPTVSYVPFVRVGSFFYIYTSGLSRHTLDLLAIERASIMFIEDEVNADNIFARKRLTFPCVSKVIPPQHEQWEEILDLFENTFGEIFTLIRPLGDFILFQLEPAQGTYVEGFGQAYRIDADLLKTTRIGGTKNPANAKARKPKK